MFVSSNCVNCVAFDPQKSNILASCSDDKTIKIWDIESGSCLSTLRGHSRDNPECTCNHRPYEANPQCPVSGHDDGVLSVCFSPDGKKIASGAKDKTVRIWDAATGAAVGSPLRGHSKDNPECTCKHGQYSYQIQADPQCPVRGHRYDPFPCIECLLL